MVGDRWQRYCISEKPWRISFRTVGKLGYSGNFFEVLRAQYGTSPREAQMKLNTLRKSTLMSLHVMEVKMQVGLAYAELPEEYINHMAIETFRGMLGNSCLQRHLHSVETPRGSKWMNCRKSDLLEIGYGFGDESRRSRRTTTLGCQNRRAIGSEAMDGSNEENRHTIRAIGHWKLTSPEVCMERRNVKENQPLDKWKRRGCPVQGWNKPQAKRRETNFASSNSVCSLLAAQWLTNMGRLRRNRGLIEN